MKRLCGLVGDEISEEQAKQKAIDVIGDSNVSEINSLGYLQNVAIPVYNFEIKNINSEKINISISKKGGYIVNMNLNREIEMEVISQNDAKQKGKEFLDRNGFENMQATYYLNQSGILTINYASVQDNVVLYPDLIKVKIALDNGEVLGMEATGYLNNHTKRDFSVIEISKEEAKKFINENLEITDEGLALIPTEFKTEILCYEFKGIVDDRKFLVYINVENGREEDILIITDTENGVFAM